MEITGMPSGKTCGGVRRWGRVRIENLALVLDRLCLEELPARHGDHSAVISEGSRRGGKRT
jgi:hypothetical protein